LYSDQNQSAALKYFRGIANSALFPEAPKLTDLLNSHYQMKFENLLNLVPFEQISYVDPKPLGRGVRGVVYRAVWSCPGKVNMPSAQEITVALKSVKVHGDKDLSWFMKEVR
jgi:hypothetical protein